jgi:hypothetical protein
MGQGLNAKEPLQVVAEAAGPSSNPAQLAGLSKISSMMEEND